MDGLWVWRKHKLLEVIFYFFFCADSSTAELPFRVWFLIQIFTYRGNYTDKGSTSYCLPLSFIVHLDLLGPAVHWEWSQATLHQPLKIACGFTWSRESLITSALPFGVYLVQKVPPAATAFCNKWRSKSTPSVTLSIERAR